MATISPELLASRLSFERLGSYLDACDGNLRRALILYEWNSVAASAFFELLADVEVVVRNSVNEQLAAWSARCGFRSPWFENEHGLLHREAVRDIETAHARLKRKANTKGPDGSVRATTPGDLICELNFGFWRFLLTKQYRTTLWPAALVNAFPELPPSEAPRLSSAMQRLHDLRNRIAHHEPVHRRRLDLDLADCDFVLRSICPETARWAASRERVTVTLSNRPITEVPNA